jgi:hypothetical protein
MPNVLSNTVENLATRLADFGWLIGQRAHHSLQRLGLGADEFDGCHDERQVIVDVMAQGGKLAAQFLDLCGGQSNRFSGQRHRKTTMR